MSDLDTPPLPRITAKAALILLAAAQTTSPDTIGITPEKSPPVERAPAPTTSPGALPRWI